MKSHIFFVVLVYTVKGEWVEITPIENKKYLSGGIKNLEHTTTVNYENFLKNPFVKPDFITTTPTYLKEKESFTEPEQSMSERSWATDLPNFNNTEGKYLNLSYDYPDQIEDATTVEEFLPFLKTIQTNLLRFKKSHKSKMSVLKHLRDQLLNNIKHIITNLWKPKVSSEARGYHEDDGHMDFPSHEGALMTIGFLTFAVFLIKLVIKLIHALKSKQQYYSMTSTTTVASVVFLKRKKRDEEHEEIAKILQYIEEF